MVVTLDRFFSHAQKRFPEAYLRSCQTSMMDYFAKAVNGFDRAFPSLHRDFIFKATWAQT